MIDPVQQIFLQAGSALTAGQGFGQAITHGFQLAQNQAKIDLDKEQQKVLLPLQREFARLRNISSGIEIDTAKRALQQQIATQSALPDVIDLQMRISDSPNGYKDPGLIEEARSLFQRFPSLAGTKEGRDLLSNFTNASKLDAAFSGISRFNQMLESQPGNQRVTGMNPETGNVQLSQPEKPEQVITPEQAHAMGLSESSATGPGGIKYSRPPQGETFEVVGPDGTVMRRTIGGAAGQSEIGKPTVAMQSRLQEGLASSIRSIGIIDQLLPLVSNETVGPTAALGGLVFDRALANVYPKLASKDRAVFRSGLSEYRANYIKEHKSDGNIANIERNEILSALPDVNRVIDSPENAKNVLEALEKLSAMRALSYAKNLGLESPKQALDTLGDAKTVESAFRIGLIGVDALRYLLDQGVISVEDLVDLSKKYGRSNEQ